MQLPARSCSSRSIPDRWIRTSRSLVLYRSLTDVSSAEASVELDVNAGASSAVSPNSLNSSKPTKQRRRRTSGNAFCSAVCT